jgi:hypothetical protein
MLATGCRIGEVLALRHTLATQAINRGMRLEAIAALLGHRSMEMTLVYARIANRVVADEHQAVSAKIDTLYGPYQPELPADYETTGMAKLRHPTGYPDRTGSLRITSGETTRGRTTGRESGQGQFVLGATG